MTRKCVMCKSKNYKNSSSFFSAPKNPDIRRLWQEAINVKGYVVNNDTYVCSKHFNKNDIITHWISGKPPHIIAIKYKKCRLRPGAVPIPIKDGPINDTCIDEQNSDITLDNEENSFDSDTEDVDINTAVQKTDQNLEKVYDSNLEDELYECKSKQSNIQEKSKPIQSDEISKKLQTKNNIIVRQDVVYSKHKTSRENLNLHKLKDNEIKTIKNQKIFTYTSKKTVKFYTKRINDLLQSESDKIDTTKSFRTEPLQELFEVDEIVSEENSKINNQSTLSSALEKDTQKYVLPFVFEDFIKLYESVSLPSNWFASLITKELTTTVMYYCMNVTKVGVPFMEKQIFLSNNMILRHGVLSKEINSSDLTSERGFSKINDINDLQNHIKKFDQLKICPGIKAVNDVMKKNLSECYFVGDNWRYNECSMILNESETICPKCALHEQFWA